MSYQGARITHIIRDAWLSGAQARQPGRLVPTGTTPMERAVACAMDSPFGGIGWTRQNIDLPAGKFHTDLVPMKLSYAFTTLASVQALIQYNNQSSLVSSNIRLALLNRSGTGLFLVYNDRRDTTTFNPYETLGRSFVAKYTRLFDF